MRNSKIVTLLPLVAMTGLLALTGCEEKSDTPDVPATAADSAGDAANGARDAGEKVKEDAEKAASEMEKAVGGG